jgi:hypothetical protein
MHSKIIFSDLYHNNSANTSENVNIASDRYCLAIVGRQFTIAK